MSSQDPSALARNVIAGADMSPNESLAVAEALKKLRQFGLARKMLDVLRARDLFKRALDNDPALRLKLVHKHSLCTYKDPDLQVDLRYTRALELLQAVDPLGTSVNQETLGQAGAIHKRMWEHTGREGMLETSLAFYKRGFDQGPERDCGYTGINAAFILDLLADLETPDQQPADAIASTVDERRADAQKIRTAVVAACAKALEQRATLAEEWWFVVTIGEAYFGLGKYDDAATWLVRAAAMSAVPDWEFESTARQLATLLRLQERAATVRGQSLPAAAREVLAKLLRHARPALESVIQGKLGVALSGGGFRASLYHIGVLARLAELDLLRSVEYLSCVSGGSIIGAHYYLEVRHLLQTKADKDITKQDYIAIVERLCRDFLAGVQRNIRTRVAAEWWTNLKMIFLSDYSRTLRAGELYEREIYARVKDPSGKSANDRKELWLDELLILPVDEDSAFRPKDHNWRRAAKVPILVLNATSLNTGHNWQFTASWMGEPPAGIDSEVDGNYRLRRMYYSDAPAPHKRMRLGHAVAASACVPGLFEPLALANLYEHLPAEGDRKVRPVVRLVDGGVYDNQGVAALLEQGCTALVVSDASGQMSAQDEPSNGLLGVPLRANSILQARVRVSQFEDLDSRRRAGLLKGLMFVHLKKDLATHPLDWIDTRDPSPPAAERPLLPYGVDRSIQRRLAAVRTDLDSFSDAEAYALMTSGYLMTRHELRKQVLGFPVGDPASLEWDFLQVADAIQQPANGNWLYRQLKVADKLALKIWFVSRNLQIAAGIVALAIFWLAVTQIYSNFDRLRESWDAPLIQLSLAALAMSVLLVLLSLAGLGILVKLINYRKTVQQILIGIGMATVGFIFARLHLHVFDRLFLRQGRIPKPSRPQKSPRQPISGIEPGQA
jgi:predicted acylesterase/phospholipase RssA